MSLGFLREFKLGESDWKTFKSRLEDYFKMNLIVKPSQLKGLLLNSLDDDAYNLLCSLSVPHKLQNKTYKELISLFDSYFSLSSTAFQERSLFYNARKAPTESCMEWMRRLRNLAIKCKFGNEFNVVIRDRFIMGMDKIPIQNILLKEDVTKLTLENALKIALQIESSGIDEYKIITFKEVTFRNTKLNLVTRNNSREASPPYYRKVYSTL